MVTPERIPSGDERDSLELRPVSADPSTGGSNGASTTYNEAQGAPVAEKSMIMRRREANRLAAHRLRVRKKGYQDSLEERIRQLEEERATLLHRLELVEPRASHGQHGPWAKKQGLAPGGGLSWSNPSLNTGYRSSGNTDTDLRVASLEAANRRLQDELKNVNEENERLQAKLLDQRTQWERSLPASSPRPNSSRFSEPQSSPHITSTPRSLPYISPPIPTQFAAPALPPISKLTPSMLSQNSPRLSPRDPYPSPHLRPSQPKRERGVSSMDSISAQSSGIQLPPLRLPPSPGQAGRPIPPNRSSDPTWHHPPSHTNMSSGQPMSKSAPASRGRTYPPWTHHPQDPRW